MHLSMRLAARFPSLALTEAFDFSRHTTIGCGGRAEVAAMPSSPMQAAALLSFLKREKIAHCILGTGANVLPADGLFRGVVVRTCLMRTLRAEGSTLVADAGVTGGALLSFAARCSVGGFEPLSGIPMSVGGAVAMNAGVRDLYIGARVRSVLAFDGEQLVLLGGAACGFSQKDSLFRREKIAVLRVWLEGRYSDAASIRIRACEYRRRRRCLPKGRSMGCAFVNPQGCSAGALIEGCGLKGARVGGAFVSREHANFIINDGGSAQDVAALAAFVRERVSAETGICLREEFCRLP